MPIKKKLKQFRLKVFFLKKKVTVISKIPPFFPLFFPDNYKSNWENLKVTSNWQKKKHLKEPGVRAFNCFLALTFCIILKGNGWEVSRLTSIIRLSFFSLPRKSTGLLQKKKRAGAGQRKKMLFEYLTKMKVTIHQLSISPTPSNTHPRYVWMKNNTMLYQKNMFLS